jgi:hypothetical protein
MKKVTLIITLLMLFLTGCATRHKNITPEYFSTQRQEGGSLVIGKLKFSNMKGVYERATIELINPETNKLSCISVDESSYWDYLAAGLPGEGSKNKEVAIYFFVHMPKGYYEIDGIYFGRGWIAKPMYSLNVPEDDSIFYVGTLEIIQKAKNNYWTGACPAKFIVSNEIEEAKEILKEKYNYEGGKIITSLMYEQEGNKYNFDFSSSSEAGILNISCSPPGQQVFVDIYTIQVDDNELIEVPKYASVELILDAGQHTVIFKPKGFGAELIKEFSIQKDMTKSYFYVGPFVRWGQGSLVEDN